MKKLLLSLLITSFLLGCDMDQEKNADVHFEYLGYGDSTLSVIYGSVLEDINGTQKPLSKVLVDIIGSNKTTHQMSLEILVLGRSRDNTRYK